MSYTGNSCQTRKLLEDKACDTDIIKFNEMLSAGTEELGTRVNGLKPKKVRARDICRTIITDITRPLGLL